MPPKWEQDMYIRQNTNHVNLSKCLPYSKFSNNTANVDIQPGNCSTLRFHCAHTHLKKKKKSLDNDSPVVVNVAFFGGNPVNRNIYKSIMFGKHVTLLKFSAFLQVYDQINVVFEHFQINGIFVVNL